MSKPEQPDPDMLGEYDFSGGIRGKYAERYTQAQLVDQPTRARGGGTRRAAERQGR